MMSAISNAETVAQVGLVKLTGGVALYAARIREMDRGAMQQKTPKRPELHQGRGRVEHLGRE